MRQMYYYQPVIRAVAKNGSERLGVHVVTQIWESDKPRRKMELSVYGETTQIAMEKFKNSLKSEQSPEPIEIPCSYFLCSEVVESHFKPFEVSKPFQSGYSCDKRSYYYVAWLNFEECASFYNDVLKRSQKIDYWLHECVSSQMDVSEITMKNAKKYGLFVEIENTIGLTKENNRAMTIFNLSQKYGCTPAQLINKYL